MPRMLKNIDVEFISLVTKGANKRTILYKSAVNRASGRVGIERNFGIAKLEEDKHLVYGIVYAVNDEDTQGDAATAAEIEKAAHKFLKSLRQTNIDKHHDENPDEGVVVESFIVQKGDARFPDDEGAWAVCIHVTSDDTWEQVKKGDITGLSMGGSAIADEIEKSGLVKTILAKVKAKFSGKKTIAKDFNEELMVKEFFTMMDAMYSTYWSIMQDETITDKQGALADSLQQFKDQFTAKKSDTPPPTGDIDMNKDEVLALIKEGVAEAVKPLIDAAVLPINTKLEAVEKTVNDGAKAIGDRVEAIEKSSAGRNSNSGQDDVPVDIKKAVSDEINEAKEEGFL